MRLYENSFSNNSQVCSVSGDLKVNSHSMKMITKQSNCPMHNTGTVTLYTYELSDSGNTLAIKTSKYGIEEKEVYKRK